MLSAVYARTHVALSPGSRVGRGLLPLGVITSDCHETSIDRAVDRREGPCRLQRACSFGTGSLSPGLCRNVLVFAKSSHSEV